MRKRQSGYLLLEVGLAILAASAVFIFLARAQTRQFELNRQYADGAQLAQLAVGLRGFIAAAQSNPAIIPGAAQTGVNWLKPTACGGLAGNPPDGYVPCSYTGGWLGPSVSTTFTRNAATGYIEARSVVLVPKLGNDNPKAHIVAADRVAQAAMQSPTLPGTFFTALSNVPATANAPANPTVDPGVNAGRVVLIASNAPSNDIWLRTDGTNAMLANLNLGGYSIANARDGRFSGDVRVQGKMQADAGLIANGPADLKGGLVTSDAALTSIGKFASEGIYTAQVLTGATSYSVPKPDCTQVGNNPGIYVAMQSTGSPNSAGYTADAVYRARADVVDAGATWTVIPVIEGTRFDMSVTGSNIAFSKTVVPSNPTDARVVVMTRCR